MVFAPQPNAAAIRVASPKPVEQPTTNTFLHSALGLHIGDLIRDMARAADRMGGGADKSSGFWFYNHEKAS